MDTISISQLRATCAATLDRVRRTGRPILVSRRGETIAQVVPPPPGSAELYEAPRQETFGSMAGTIEIVADLVRSPVEEETSSRRDEREVLPPLTRSLFGIASGNDVTRDDHRQGLEDKHS